ncbi:endospore germination permease [Ammoniphilus sp. 3BR4]|uniref:GerAB/ArcD/ProY family transporter n=1 Tax=Ammoniphilus sp. 3BR4 TaxID=3158265 RepID=UPI00346550AA
MIENGKITARQFAILVFFFTIGGSVLILPAELAEHNKQDAWITLIFDIGMGMGLILLYNALGSLFPGKNLMEYAEELLGKWLGKAVSLVFVFYFIHSTAVFLRQIGAFMTIEIMQETPIQAVHIFFLAVVIMGVRLGLEPISRVGELLFPWIFFLFALLSLSVANQIETVKIQPILGKGIEPVIMSSFRFLGNPFLQLSIFLMVFPYVNRIAGAKKSFLTGTFMGGCFLLVITFLCIAVLGASNTSVHFAPAYYLAKKINVGDFFQRVEALMAGIWFVTIFFKVTICFYASCLGLAQIFNLRGYRFLTYPLGIIVVVFSLVLSPNMVHYQTVVFVHWTAYSLTFGLCFPLLLLGIAALRKKKAIEQEKANNS